MDKIQYRKKAGKIIFEIGLARLFSLTNAFHYSEQKNRQYKGIISIKFIPGFSGFMDRFMI